MPLKYRAILAEFCHSYEQSCEEISDALLQFVDLVAEQFAHPYRFASYHQKIRSPIDYYRFSLDFVRPLIEREKSRILGLDRFDTVQKALEKGENAIFLANHQAEADPQAIALLLEPTHPALAEKIIYVAGERVITDPLAIPFSMGCDLLCIYSKRYIDYPPELKAQKQLHNKQTMERMSRLLEEGGKAIYVAPSGGRDRRGASGAVEVAPFDPQSIEMFYLMARKAKTPTHFYPLALATYDLLPPPETIQRELGEARRIRRAPIHLALGEEFDMEHYAGCEQTDKELRRQARADALWEIVNTWYRDLTS